MDWSSLAVKHPHDMSDSELLSTLNNLCDAGILRMDSEESDVYCMTAKGGLEWERERKPAWDRLVSDHYGELRSGTSTVTILATSRDIGEQFWKSGCEFGLFTYTSGRLKTRTIRKYPMIYWRPPVSVYAIHATVDDRLCDTDWNKLEQRSGSIALQTILDAAVGSVRSHRT